MEIVAIQGQIPRHPHAPRPPVDEGGEVADPRGAVNCCLKLARSSTGAGAAGDPGERQCKRFIKVKGTLIPIGRICNPLFRDSFLRYSATVDCACHKGRFSGILWMDSDQSGVSLVRRTGSKKQIQERDSLISDGQSPQHAGCMNVPLDQGAARCGHHLVDGRLLYLPRLFVYHSS